MESKGCLICSSTGTQSFTNTRIVGVAMKKILKYLHIPKESSQELLATSLSYCESCYSMVNEIVDIATKIEALELLIQQKAHDIGTKVMRSPVSNKIGPAGINPKNFAMLWERFKKPVIENYVSKKLPDPCVRISHADKAVVNIKKESMEVDTGKFVVEPAPVSVPKAVQGLSQRVIVKRGVKKAVPIKKPTPSRKVKTSIPQKIKQMTSKITCGVRIGPKCYLKRIGREGPTQKDIKKGPAKKLSSPANVKSENKTGTNVRVGPKSYLKKIGRFDGTGDQIKSHNAVGPPLPKSPPTRKIIFKPISLTTTSSSQQPEKAESSLGSKLFQEVKLTKAQVDALDDESLSSENSESDASTDPYVEYVQDKVAIRKRKRIKEWLDSIETPSEADSEEELLDILLIALVLTENCTRDKSTGTLSCKHCQDFTISLLDSVAFTSNLLLNVVTHIAEAHYFLNGAVESTSSDSDTSAEISSTSHDSRPRQKIQLAAEKMTENDIEETSKIKCPVCQECIATKAKLKNTKDRDLSRILSCHYFKSHMSVPLKPRFSLRHQKTGYYCDKCDFFSEVIYLQTSLAHQCDSRKAWCARKVLVKHHMEFHLTNDSTEELGEPEENYNMNTSFDHTYLDVNVPVHDELDTEMQEEEYESDGDFFSLLEPEVILSYPSSNEETLYNDDENEKKEDAEPNEPVKYETDDKFVCPYPNCTFTTPKRNLDRQSALNKLLTHYRKEHLPARSNERLKNEKGEDYFECIHCDYKALVEYSSALGVFGPQCRYETRLKLALHYVSEHSTKQLSSSGAKAPITGLQQDLNDESVQIGAPNVETEDKNQSLPSPPVDSTISSSGKGFRRSVQRRSSVENEGSNEVFKCPVCDFISASDVCVAESVKIRVYRARQKVYSHYALSHLEEIILIKNDTGVEGYRCTSCDYFAKLGAYKSGYHAKYFAKTALAKHILEDHEEEHVDPLVIDLPKSDATTTETEECGEAETDYVISAKSVTENDEATMPEFESESMNSKTNPKTEVEVIEIDSENEEDAKATINTINEEESQTVSQNEAGAQTSTENEGAQIVTRNEELIEFNHPKINTYKTEVEVIEIDSSSDEDQEVLVPKPKDNQDMDCDSECDVPVIKNVFSQYQWSS